MMCSISESEPSWSTCSAGTGNSCHRSLPNWSPASVGGTDTTAVNDKTGPKIDIYFDDVTFKNSYLVNTNSKLIIKLSDPTGLNTTGTGIGHNIEGVLNDDINNPIDFTTYFTGDLDAGGKSGQHRDAANRCGDAQERGDLNDQDIHCTT